MNPAQADSVLLAVPFVMLLAAFVFRIDALLFSRPAKPQAGERPRHRFANFDASSTTMTDPDGRLPQAAGARTEARRRQRTFEFPTR